MKTGAHVASFRWLRSPRCCLPAAARRRSSRRPTHLRADEPRAEGHDPAAGAGRRRCCRSPKAATRPETYSVVVNNVRVQELLFALARDARLNVDIHPDITGTVTLNAIDQTLPQLLTRIARQVDMRYEMDGQNLAVMRDTPFLRIYRVDYVNMARDATRAWPAFRPR